MARMIVRNLLTSIILYEDVRTTKKRAQVVRPLVDRMITIAKKKRIDLAIREINTYVTDVNACRKVIEVLKERYPDRTSGFTTVKAAGMRKGDGASLVDVAFIPGKEVAPAPSAEQPKKEKKAPAAKKKTSTSTKKK